WPRLGGVIGLPCAGVCRAGGVVLGPSVLGVAPRTPPVAAFFSDIGKLLLMFFAGLEIDIAQFSRSRHRSLAFGALTFALPLLVGLGLGRAFGYGWVASLLIGSLLASHTLLGLPIVQRLGLSGNEAVTVTVGATILTDLAALLVLAICLPVHSVGFRLDSFLVQLAQLAIYVPAVLFGLSALVRRLLRRWGDTRENEFFL